MDIKKITKKVNVSLVGVDGNAYAIIGTWQKQARREGWTKEEMDAVIDEAKSGNYDHLIQTILSYSE